MQKYTLVKTVVAMITANSVKFLYDTCRLLLVYCTHPNQPLRSTRLSSHYVDFKDVGARRLLLRYHQRGQLYIGEISDMYKSRA